MKPANIWRREREAILAEARRPCDTQVGTPFRGIPPPPPQLIYVYKVDAWRFNITIRHLLLIPPKPTYPIKVVWSQNAITGAEALHSKSVAQQKRCAALQSLITAKHNFPPQQTKLFVRIYPPSIMSLSCPPPKNKGGAGWVMAYTTHTRTKSLTRQEAISTPRLAPPETGPHTYLSSADYSTRGDDGACRDDASFPNRRILEDGLHADHRPVGNSRRLHHQRLDDDVNNDDRDGDTQVRGAGVARHGTVRHGARRAGERQVSGDAGEYTRRRTQKQVSPFSAASLTGKHKRGRRTLPSMKLSRSGASSKIHTALHHSLPRT